MRNKARNGEGSVRKISNNNRIKEKDIRKMRRDIKSKIQGRTRKKCKKEW